MYRRFSLLVLLLLVTVLAYADVRLPKIFSENMVLQQGIKSRIWGWAETGEKVTVTLAGQQRTTIAQDGKWEVFLDALKAGGPFTLRVNGNNTLELQNILVGEVWVSCGQSNMMMSLSSIENGAQLVAESGKFPQIRLFNMPGQQYADAPLTDLAGGKWQIASPGASNDFSAVSYCFGRALYQKLHVPIGLINAVSIMPAEAWIDRETVFADPRLKDLPNKPIKAITSYNAMIAPLTKFGIRGAIYYQGEYNAGRGKEFQLLMPALISSWRKNWGLGDFPFLFVQLSAYDHQGPAEKNAKMDMPQSVLDSFHKLGARSAWAELREAQLLTWQRVPNTGMAVTIDYGDALDIHPKRKQPIGERLALIARALAYKEKIEYSGPVFAAVSKEANKLLLTFTHVDGGLEVKNGLLKGFEIAGADQKYVMAQGEIRKNTLLLWNPAVSNPLVVRYAWADYPQFSLYNKAGLPATPFRSFINGKAVQLDGFTFNFRNPSFESDGDWVLNGGATRDALDATDGKLALTEPPKGSAAEDEIRNNGMYAYDWNGDLIYDESFRPGTIVGYSVDMAADAGEKAIGYMRLCINSSAAGYQYWGGIPEISTSSTKPVTRKIATRMSTTFDTGGYGAIGILVANLQPKGNAYFDNFSPLTVLRPRLAISSVQPFNLGTVIVKAMKISEERFISNGQKGTLPNLRNDGETVSDMATLLYGTANITSELSWGFVHACSVTDQVGAKIIGKDAALFEFVSEHLGATARELKLIGADGNPGLTGGPTPETEKLQVRFLGAAKPGTYQAIVRVITQTGNMGVVSTGKRDEPLEGLFYVDIPVVVVVK